MTSGTTISMPYPSDVLRPSATTIKVYLNASTCCRVNMRPSNEQCEPTALKQYFPLCIISGAEYLGVPTMLDAAAKIVWAALEVPKSEILARVLLPKSKTLCGFKSRWAILDECKYLIPLLIQMQMRIFWLSVRLVMWSLSDPWSAHSRMMPKWLFASWVRPNIWMMLGYLRWNPIIASWRIKSGWSDFSLNLILLRATWFPFHLQRYTSELEPNATGSNCSFSISS